MSDWSAVSDVVQAGAAAAAAPVRAQARALEAPAPAGAPQDAGGAWDAVSETTHDYSGLPLDYDTGGQVKAHALASAAAPGNRLAIIRKFHPGAFLYTGRKSSPKTRAGLPPEQAVDEPEIVFPDDPEKPTKLIAFNPRGLDWGDLADQLGTGIRTASQVVGAIAGTFARKDPLEGAVAGLGLGALLDMGMGELSNYLARKAAGVEEQRDPKEIVADVASAGIEDVGVGAPAMAVGAGVSNMVKSAANKGFGVPLLKQMSRTEKLGVAGKGRPDVAAAIERQAIDPDATAPLITDSPTVGNLVDAARQFPRAADRNAEAVTRFRDSLDRAWDRSLGKLGSTEKEPVAAGARGQWAINKKLEGLKRQQGNLETAVEADIGPETLVDAGGLGTHINEILRRAVGPDGKPLASAGQTVPPFLRAVLKDLEANNGKLPFGHLRDLRRQWDAKAAWGQPDVQGMPQAFRDAANAARHDLTLAAEAKGGRAASNWRDAMENWTAHERIQEQFGRLANSPEAERAFQAIVSGDRLGPTRLNAFKKLVEETDPGAWPDVVAVRMRQQVLDKDGRLDPIKMDELWGNGPKAYPESVKNILAPKADSAAAALNPEVGELRQMWDDLALIGRRMRQTRFELEGSPTARRAENMKTVGEGGAGVAVKALAKGVSGVAHPVDALKRYFGDVGELMRGLRADEAMKLYQSKPFRDWLINGQKTPPVNPNGVAAHLSKLTAVGAQDHSLREPIRKLVNSMQQDFAAATGAATGAGEGREGGGAKDGNEDAETRKRP